MINEGDTGEYSIHIIITSFVHFSWHLFLTLFFAQTLHGTYWGKPMFLH